MRAFRSIAILAVSLSACAEPEVLTTGGDDNPFLVDQTPKGKADSQYLNPDGIEVEVDIEADVEAPDHRLGDAPAVLGQFAMTYLRRDGTIYLESLAEQATSGDRVEWKVGDDWVAAKDNPTERKRFRIRGINAILLHDARDGVDVGKVFKAPVPMKPFSIMSDAGDTCAEKDGHITLDQSVYWYLWDPDRSGCKATVQDMSVTVSKMLPSKVTWPEYDQLVADGKVTAVILFGQIGDGPITDSDPGVRNFNTMARWLLGGKFQEIKPAPVGRRFTKKVGAVDLEVDLYSPKDFSGLSDFAHIGNFEKALNEHEIVAYDGHSMLGASDFWSREYPDFYQIYLYGGCLGYEYYVAPIVEGKGGWDKVDIMSSVIEVTADANLYAGPFLAKLIWALQNDYAVSWKDYLVEVRRHVGDSTFGVSGVRENCFSPGGSLCGPDAPESALRYTDDAAAAIPDADKKGISRTLTIADDVVAATVTVELDVAHSYVSDLRITLEHDGVKVVVWNHAGENGTEIRQSFTAEKFAGKSIQGDWTLKVVDSEAQDTGTLESWSLAITPQ